MFAIHTYLYGPAIDMVLVDEISATNVLWPLADNQGTIRDITNTAGAVQNHITYNSFGRIISQTNANVYTRFNYTGREFDGETGLYYYRSRYYDCVVGRFLSEDAIGFKAGDANLYRYVGNSPVNAIDPFGRASPELTTLIMVACGSQRGGACDQYPPAQDYLSAFRNAEMEFEKIVDKSTIMLVPNPKLDFYIKARLKGGGNATLRPKGVSGVIPTIDISKHGTKNYENVDEIKFRYFPGKNPNPNYCPVPNIIQNKPTPNSPFKLPDLRWPDWKFPNWQIPPIPIPIFDPRFQN
jgi:RHS repeat-associated protein